MQEYGKETVRTVGVDWSVFKSERKVLNGRGRERKSAEIAEGNAERRKHSADLPWRGPWATWNDRGKDCYNGDLSSSGAIV